MICRSIAPLVTLLLALGVPAWADGLLYQLPQDGAWVLFDAEIALARGDQKVDGTGTLRMSSIGTAVEDGVKCRWIEFNLTMDANGQNRVIVSKLLVPEDQLTEGKKPVEHRVRGWIRMGAGNEVVELSDSNLGPIPAFIANPLTNVQQIEAKIVASKLGELSCSGLTGNTEFAERTTKNKVAFETRRHEKAPFGVVTSRMKIDVERDGNVTESLDMSLQLHDLGEAAISELPDHN